MDTASAVSKSAWPVQNAEAAALVLGAHGSDIVVVDEDGGRRGDQSSPH